MPPRKPAFRKIPLANGRGFALVDPADYDWLAGFPWHHGSDGYAATTLAGRGVTMHRLILGPAPEGQVADHRNRRRLDNRRKNLRFATRSQNAANRSTMPKHARIHSRYRGVAWHKYQHAWQVVAQDPTAGKLRHLGYFRSERAAARAYDAWVRQHYGDYANPNFKRPQERRRAAA